MQILTVTDKTDNMRRKCKNVKGGKFHCCDHCGIGIGKHTMFTMTSRNKHLWITEEHEQQTPNRVKIKGKVKELCDTCKKNHHEDKERKKNRKVSGIPFIKDN